MNSNSPTQAWDRYWRSGALHSCAGSFSGNYGEELRDFWLQVFGNLSAGDRVLEIGCGNGALACLMLEARSGKDVPGYDGIDLAQVDSGLLPESAAHRVRLHPRVAAEALPFADGSFSAAVSQFGIEYSAWDRAVAEVGRTVRGGGTIAWVVHHADSLICRAARSEIADAHWLIGASGLLSRAEALLPYVMLLREAGGRERLQRDPAARAARLAYNECQAALQERASRSAYPDLLEQVAAATAQAVAGALGGTGPALDGVLQALRASVEGGAERLADLLSHALDAAEVARMEDALRSAGFFTQPPAPMFVRGELFAWALEARRGSPGHMTGQAE